LCNAVLTLSEYFAEYDAYKNMPDLIDGMDEEDQEQKFDKEEFYRINNRFLAMLSYAAIEIRNPEIVESLLGILNNEIISIILKVVKEADKYPMLINSENIENLYYNVRLLGFELIKLLETIEREYSMYNGIILWISKIKPLCEGKYNLSDYELHMRVNISEFDFM
jgi:hypothetical protein